MPPIAKQSVKVELDAEDFEGSVGDLLEDTFYTAISKLVEEKDELDTLLSKFFTFRFDITETGVVAATLTASAKRS